MIGVGLWVLDKGWTAYDIWQAQRILNNPKSTQQQKRNAEAQIALAVGAEILEPDEWTPFNLPLDDLARHGVVIFGGEAAAGGANRAARQSFKHLEGLEWEGWLRNRLQGTDAFRAGGREFDVGIGNTWIEANGQIPEEIKAWLKSKGIGWVEWIDLTE